jgi:hypothetical protein
MNKKLDGLINWLSSHPKGVYIQTFGDDLKPSEKDMADAARFAEGLRKNIGDSKIASVEVSYNKVITRLLLVPSKV